MPVKMSNVEMDDLAKKLAKMKFRKAVWYIRQLDKHVRLDLYRSSVNDGELHTRFALPEQGIWITLIEQKVIKGQPSARGNVRQQFNYVEAQVQPIPDSVVQDKQLTPY